MALHPVEGIAGPPWERPLAGTIDKLVVESELLAGNPLGDPARRPLYVYLPPGADAGELPSVYVLQGYGGQLDSWWSRPDFELSTFERLDAMFAAGDCPPAVIVFVDAWTALRRLAVPQLAEHRPLHGLHLRRGRAVHRRALSDQRRAATGGRFQASRRVATARWCSR